MKRSITRRQALKTLATAATGAAVVGLYAWRIEPHWLEFTYPVLAIAGLPRELEGCTIAQLSDLHVSKRVHEDYIVESFLLVHKHTPDFVDAPKRRKDVVIVDYLA